MSLKSFFLACFIVSQVAGQSPTYQLKGLEVIWKPSLPYQPDDILWKHNGNKVVEFNGQEQQEFGKHQGRIILDWVSAELTIRDLRFEDSGVYDLEISRGNKDLLRFTYKLEVIDKVAKPTISCEKDDGSDSKNSGTLVCSAESRQTESLMKYEWRSRGTVQPGQNLTIPLGETHDDQVYSCTVRNPLSNETATFTAKDCYPDESSSVALTAAVVPITIIALLVLGGLVLFLKQRRKACFAEREKQPLPRRREESHILLDRAPTFPSSQPLIQADHMDQQQDEKPPQGHVKKMTEKYEPKNARMRLSERSENDKKTAEDAGYLLRCNKRSITEPPPDRLKNLNAAKVPACFVKGKNADLDKQSSPEITEDLDKNKDEHENITPPPSSPRSESPALQEQNNLARSDKGDADADQPEESAEGEEEEDPAGVSEMESSAAPEQPESEKESNEDKEPVSPPARGSRPVPPPRPPRTSLTYNFPISLPEDTAEDRTEEASLDHGETLRDDSVEAETSFTSPERKDSETSPHEQDKDKDKTDKSASAVENESDREGDGELKDNEDLYLAPSEQPQSPSPAKPDNSTAQESADAAQADPDQEEKGKTRHESGEGEGKIVDDEN